MCWWRCGASDGAKPAALTFTCRRCGAAAAANALSLAPQQQQWVVDPLPPSQRTAAGAAGAPLTPRAPAPRTPGRYLPPRVEAEPSGGSPGDVDMVAAGGASPQVTPAVLLAASCCSRITHAMRHSKILFISQGLVGL